MVKVDELYTSASCNVYPGSFDLNGSVLCFASSQSLLACDLKEPFLVRNLGTEHSKPLNCVAWVKTTSGYSQFLITGSADCHLGLWNIPNLKSASLVEKFKAHNEAVTCLDAIIINNNYENNDDDDGKCLFVASSSSDSSTKIWIRNGSNSNLKLVDTVNNSNLILCLSLFPLGQEGMILACGSDRNQVILYMSPNNTDHQPNQFVMVHVLTECSDWVKGLDFIYDNNDLLLASGCQDNYVRVWNISCNNKETEIERGAKGNSPRCPSQTLNVEKNKFKVSNSEVEFKVSMETVLHGHQNWIHSVKWFAKDGKLSLISSSLDKSVIGWERSRDQGEAYSEQFRLGETGGQGLGFIGAKINKGAENIVALNYSGAFYFWSSNQDNWVLKPITTGHRFEVRGLCWSCHGDYLISVGEDKSARIHQKLPKQKYWAESSRSQIHGHPLSCVASTSPFSYSSGAEEKIIRVFKAPNFFVKKFKNSTERVEDEEEEGGVLISALGLSTKSSSHLSPLQPSHVATESDLISRTLWLEQQKIYGHSFSIFCLACSPDNQILASACKATSKEAATIYLHQTDNWKILQKLEHHSLTVTSLSFSHSGKFLLSVSRDRNWALFKRNDENYFRLFCHVTKATTSHSRIIWSCSWSHDDLFFATCSRDKKIIVWEVKENEKQDGNEIKEEKEGVGVSRPSIPFTASDSVTSVDFCPLAYNEGSYLIAAGMETGLITLLTWSFQQAESWQQLYIFNPLLSHHKTVTGLCWRPFKKNKNNDDIDEEEVDGNSLFLSSSGEDGMVKIFKIQITK